MKRIYLPLMAIAVGLNATAQTSTEDFESSTLMLDTFQNGANANGEFQFSNFRLINDYDTIFGGIWNGFSMSTMRDDTTAGFTNQYSAITAGGHQSDVYAVGYTPDVGESEIIIEPIIDNSIRLESIRITNATYVYFNLKDGDAFSEKFGGPSGNDPDYLRLHIVLAIGEENIDTIEFNLADYTFSNNNEDYIVDDWEEVDLTPFDTTISDTASLKFYLSASDSAFGNIAPPRYFCIDDITYSFVLGLDEFNSETEFTAVHGNNGVSINANTEAEARIYDLSGRLLKTRQIVYGRNEISFDDLAPGWNIVSLTSENSTYSIKVHSH